MPKRPRNAAPALGWAGQAVLEFRCAAGDWAGALAALDRNSRYSLIDKAEYRRQRAVLLTARALAAEESDRDRARSLALDAVKLAPTLVPAAELAGRLLGEAGELRRASRIIEKAWAGQSASRSGRDLRASAAGRFRARAAGARADAGAARRPAHAEGALAVARAALDAQEFAVARNALRPLLQASRRSASPTLMAEIEQRESGDEGRAREWMARALRAPRDPAWTADGFVSDRWMPVSPVSGRLDAFQWKVPLAELGDAREVIEGDELAARPRRRSCAAPPAAACARRPPRAAPSRAPAAEPPPRCQASRAVEPPKLRRGSRR